MNRKQLILILVALGVLGGAGLVMMNNKQASWSAPEGKMGQKLFPNFPVNDIAAIHIQAANDVHLEMKDGKWRIRERLDYPANFSQIHDLLIKLLDLKITQSEPIDASQLGRMNLEEPGKGTNSGTEIDFLDKQSKPVQSLILGKNHMQESSRPSQFGGGEFPDGRYVLIPSDKSDLLLVSDPLESVAISPESWLDRDFFKIEKLESVSMVSTNATNSWKLSRQSESSPWVLADTKAEENLDSNKVSSLAGTVSFPSFMDVASNTAPSITGLDKPLALTFTTFDHFNYDIKIGSKNPEGNFYMTVATTADLPTQRTPGKDEKPEDKAKLDKEFQDKNKELQDKLAKEKALTSWVYLVNTGLVDPLIRTRSELMVEKTAETNTPAGGTTNSFEDLIKPAVDGANLPK